MAGQHAVREASSEAQCSSIASYLGLALVVAACLQKKLLQTPLFWRSTHTSGVRAQRANLPPARTHVAARYTLVEVAKHNGPPPHWLWLPDCGLPAVQCHRHHPNHSSDQTLSRISYLCQTDRAPRWLGAASVWWHGKWWDASERMPKTRFI